MTEAKTNSIARHLPCSTQAHGKPPARFAILLRQMSVSRCAWAGREPNLTYHDTEWGVPVWDDDRLFEMLVLEGAQSGLSWETVLKKRAGYREEFANFHIPTVAAYGEAEIQRMLANPGVIRHRGKLESAVQNARAAMNIQETEGSLASFLWSFVDGKPIVNHWTESESLPAQTELSVKMSKALLKRGFRFVGPTTVYAFMQAAGFVNDHTVDCFRYSEVQA